MDSSKNTIMYWDGEDSGASVERLIVEEPLSIRIQGRPYSVVMRTPGDEIAHAAGFCLGEGILDTMDDVENIGFCDGEDTNVVTVTLKPGSRDRVADILDRRGFISQTSCGICGKEIIDDLNQVVLPIEKQANLDPEKALNQLEAMSANQPLREKTRAAHGAMIYDDEFRLLSFAEDVGRHNALDKAVGKVFLTNDLDKAVLLILSSRISFELVQKAARACIPIVVAISRPTSLAVSLAQRLGITLACKRKGKGLLVFCNGFRFGLNEEHR